MVEWQAHLREDSQFGNIESLCENGGFTAAWRGRDIVLVFAPRDDMVAPFSLKLEFVRGENTLMMGLGVPACPWPDQDGEHTLYEAFDMGDPHARTLLTTLIGQPRVAVVIVCDSGAPVQELDVPADLLERIRGVLDETTELRALDSMRTATDRLGELVRAVVGLAAAFDRSDEATH